MLDSQCHSSLFPLCPRACVRSLSDRTAYESRLVCARQKLELGEQWVRCARLSIYRMELKHVQVGLH